MPSPEEDITRRAMEAMALQNLNGSSSGTKSARAGSCSRTLARIRAFSFSITYGGLPRTRSKSPSNPGHPARTSEHRKRGATTPGGRSENWLRARSSAGSEISTAVTAVPGISKAMLHAMQPEPVHRSSTFPPCPGVRRKASASPTSCSVSGLGMSTEGFTLNLRPRNQEKPSTY